jgi:ion channel-forming bestrophin family protein
MQVLRFRTVGEVLHWTRKDILFLFILASIPTTLYQVTGWKRIALPWLLIALVGTAVSFIVGFKNNASYNRAWEARKIWGSIVNSSRSLVASLTGYIDDTNLTETERQRLLLRVVNNHIAWLTALRYQLREPKGWESMHVAENLEVRDKHYIMKNSIFL